MGSNKDLTDADLLRAVNAFEEARHNRAEAARRLSMSPSTLYHQLALAKQRKIKPTVEPPPERDSLKLFGTSTLRDADGNVILEWEKRKEDAALVEKRIRALVQGLIEPVKGLHKPIKAPKKTNADLLTEYLLTDCHLSLYCWRDETGSDWDLDIAEKAICDSFDQLLSATPPSHTAFVNNLGDYFHVDNKQGTTTAGTFQDFDSRYFKMITVGVRVMRYCIGRVLTKHKQVIVRITGGNHDEHSIVALIVALQGHYENDPRVTIEADPTPFWALHWHNVLIGTAHGNDPKPAVLPKILAHDYPEAWARAQHKYIRHGHFHSKAIFEDMGVEVECVRTLAPNDAWHQGKGYRSKKAMQAVVHHKQDGEIERHIRGAHLNATPPKNPRKV
jgi:transposase-like protein/DNA-directed RNA polymerase subunit N (RpoN/RPB10)